MEGGGGNQERQIMAYSDEDSTILKVSAKKTFFRENNAPSEQSFSSFYAKWFDDFLKFCSAIETLHVKISSNMQKKLAKTMTKSHFSMVVLPNPNQSFTN